ncbi:hypothetical protein T05_7471 [Trichinella murrelli]|uniref:Uncharacterized protein n=1 Tax=Trichinella murrelli TaxID=144512 RepID=A0A0V0UC30_9BILA|nr:hypothetical protein T05_7471 [Trichinella murrelli]
MFYNGSSHHLKRCMTYISVENKVRMAEIKFKQISASVGTFGVDCKLYAQAMYSCEIKHHRVIRIG